MPLCTLEQIFPNAPQSTYDHLREIAEESGYDLDEEMAVSSEREITVPGYPHPIETWYQESATWQPFRAFIKGHGTFYGWTAEEAAIAAATAAA